MLSLLRVDSRSDVREVYEVALYYVAQGCRSVKPELVEDAVRLLSQCASKVQHWGRGGWARVDMQSIGHAVDWTCS